MNVKSPKMRRWLQIHLSTACVVLLVASGLLWMNVRMRYQELGDSVSLPFSPLGEEESFALESRHLNTEEKDIETLPGLKKPTLWPAGQGWPFVYWPARRLGSMGFSGFLPPRKIDYQAGAIDCCIALFVLAGTAFLLEMLIYFRGRDQDKYK